MQLQSGELLFGRYRAGDLVRPGRFSRVYRVTSEAPQSGVLDVQAVKIIFRDAPGLMPTLWEDYQKRFSRELELAGRFSHPNFLVVTGFDQDEEKLALEMALAPGGNLADRLNQARQSGQPVPVEDVIQIARDAALGLEALHLRGLVHRNIKPANLLVSDQGRVWVADAGQAQTPEEADERQAGRLATRHPGTLAFMSPEQEIKTGALTPAADIYTLGLVLFELLTGRNYKNARAGIQASGLRPDVPAWIDTLLAQMLAPAPAERVSDGGSLARLLQDGARQIQQLHAQDQAAQAKSDALSQQEADRQRTLGEARVALEETEKKRQKEEEPRLANRLLKERAKGVHLLRARERQKREEEVRVQATQTEMGPPAEPATLIEPIAKPEKPAQPPKAPLGARQCPHRPGLNQRRLSPHLHGLAYQRNHTPIRRGGL